MNLKSLHIFPVIFSLIIITSCNSKRLPAKMDSPEAIAAAMVLAASEASGRYIIWAKTADHAITTLLVEGNSSHAKVEANAEGLFIPAPQGVWQLGEDTQIRHLCDCEKYAKQNYKGSCPPLTEDIFIKYPQLQNSTTSQTQNIIKSSHLIKNISDYADYKLSSHVVATIGPYLFTDYSQYALDCRGTQGTWTSGYSVLNMETGKFEDILSKDEHEWMLDHEQSTAAKNLNIYNVDELTLSSVEPLFFSVGFVINLHFYVESQFTHTGENTNAYSQSTIVSAKGIPEKLMPYAQVPPVLGNLLFGDSTAQIGGWFTLTGRENEIAVIKEIFVNSDSSLTSETTEDSLNSEDSEID